MIKRIIEMTAVFVTLTTISLVALAATKYIQGYHQARNHFFDGKHQCQLRNAHAVYIDGIEDRATIIIGRVAILDALGYLLREEPHFYLMVSGERVDHAVMIADTIMTARYSEVMRFKFSNNFLTAFSTVRFDRANSGDFADRAVAIINISHNIGVIDGIHARGEALRKMENQSTVGAFSINHPVFGGKYMEVL